MSKILSLIAVLMLFASVAQAQSTRIQAKSDLVGLGLSSELAEEIAELATGLGVVSNNIYLKGRNAANSANIDMLKVDATDDTVLNADTGDTVKIAVAGTTQFTVDSTGTLIGTGTSSIGWTVVAGANTACNTTCVTPCVFGVNTAATEADIVGCADATADECLCAGAT